jgi:outer membrane cobalamin receptor
MNNPIESAIKFTGTSSATLQPTNFGTATNYGLEATFAKYFGKLGISGNYTFKHNNF